MKLVDTSAWIEVFRRGGPQLETIMSLEEAVTCLPIVQEVLQGFRDERAFRIAREAMLAMPIIESPLVKERFLEAADLYRNAQRQGYTIRSSVDCLIAVCAIRHDLEVIHHDRDFRHLARVSNLRERTI